MQVGLLSLNFIHNSVIKLAYQAVKDNLFDISGMYRCFPKLEQYHLLSWTLTTTWYMNVLVKTSFIVDNVDSQQIIMAGVLSEAETAFHLRPTGFISDFFRGPCFSLFCFELCFCTLLVFLLCFVCPMLPVSFLYRLFNTSGRYSGLNRCQWCQALSC